MAGWSNNDGGRSCSVRKGNHFVPLIVLFIQKYLQNNKKPTIIRILLCCDALVNKFDPSRW